MRLAFQSLMSVKRRGRPRVCPLMLEYVGLYVETRDSWVDTGVCPYGEGIEDTYRNCPYGR